MEQVLEKCVIFRSSGEGVEAVIKSTRTEIASVISERFHLAKRSSLLTTTKKERGECVHPKNKPTFCECFAK